MRIHDIRWPWVRRTHLDAANRTIQAETVRANRASERLDQVRHAYDVMAEGATQENRRANIAMNETIPELERALAEEKRMREHFERSHIAVCEERDELRARLRDIEQPDGTDAELGDKLADSLQSLVTGEWRTEKTPKPERAELLRDFFQYPHESTHPALIADHLPHCELCTEGLKHLPYADLMAVGKIAQGYGSADVLDLFESEHKRRQSLSKEELQAIEGQQVQHHRLGAIPQQSARK